MADRTALVTGAGRGIGLAVARRLAEAGYRVVGAGRGAASLEAARAALAEDGLPLRTAICDVTDEQQVGALVAEVGRVAVLVNNAGVSTSAPLERTSLPDWTAQLTANATAAFLTTRAFLPAMRAAGWGRIVNVASTAALTGAAYTAAYTASKHALLGLTRVTATEVAGTGITCNAVCPTFVRTDMTRRTVERITAATGRTPEEAERALTRAAPLGRLLEPEEVAAAVDYLAGEAAGCVNGQALVLDGGGVHA